MKFLSTTFSLAHVLQGSMGREFFYFFKILSTVTPWSGPGCMCGNTLAAGRKHSWVAHATTICDICAIWQRDFSVFPGRQAPSPHCCHGHILSQSILEWRRVLSCCFPWRLSVHFPLPCVQYQRARIMVLGEAPGTTQQVNESLAAEPSKPQPGLQLQPDCTPHLNIEFGNLLTYLIK